MIAAIGVENPRVRVHKSHYERGFGNAIRAGLDVFEGDAVAIVMADASDDPRDLVALRPAARRRLGLRLRLALHAGRRAPRLPAR